MLDPDHAAAGAVEAVTSVTGHVICDIAGFEAAIGPFPPAAALKVIAYPDPGALAWIARSPLFFAGLAGATTVAVTVGARGEAAVEADVRESRIPLDLRDRSGDIVAGTAFASLFLLPGIGETLRVNGTAVGMRENSCAADL